MYQEISKSRYFPVEKRSFLLRHRKPLKIKDLNKLRDFEGSGGHQILEICDEGKS
jgi:hypothetical protein